MPLQELIGSGSKLDSFDFNSDVFKDDDSSACTTVNRAIVTIAYRENRSLMNEPLGEWVVQTPS